MARTRWLACATEEGLVEASRALVCVDGEAPPTLDALDFALLAKWSEQKPWRVMAAECGVSVPTVRARAARPAFQATLARLQRNWFDQLARGEFGALAIAKANAVGAVRRTLALARGAQNERVKLEANRDLIKLAGVTPPAATPTQRPEELLDLMTPDELEHFSLTNEFPKRLADKLARVAATVLQARPVTVVEAEAVWERSPEAAALDAESAPPVEEADEDGPAWASLPDETELEGAVVEPPRAAKRLRGRGRRAA